MRRSKKQDKPQSRLNRDSNYELMRISSMFMIIVWHILKHGQVDANSSGLVTSLVFLLQAIIVVHVNSYILVTGYYQCKSKFKFSKLLSINNAAWFYRVVIMLSLLGLEYIKVGKVEFLQMISPFDFTAYWFIKFYLILYCFSPFLNALIEHLDKKKFQYLLLVTFIVFSVLPSISMQEIYDNGGGYSLQTMILLYLLGAYFRYYPIKESRIFQVNTNRRNQLIFFCLFVGMFLINYLLYNFGSILMGKSEITDYFGKILLTTGFSYDNPLVVIGAVMYFLWFGTLQIKSKFINRVSGLTLGIYFIHDNPYIRQLIYPMLGFTDNKIYTGQRIFVKIFACAIVIFIVCALIEWIRQWIFKKGNQTKIVKWFQKKTHAYVASLSH